MLDCCLSLLVPRPERPKVKDFHALRDAWDLLPEERDVSAGFRFTPDLRVGLITSLNAFGVSGTIARSQSRCTDTLPRRRLPLLELLAGSVGLPADAVWHIVAPLRADILLAIASLDVHVNDLCLVAGFVATFGGNVCVSDDRGGFSFSLVADRVPKSPICIPIYSVDLMGRFIEISP